MSNIPKLLTKEQLAGLLIDSIAAKVGVLNDLNQGSVLSQLIDAIAQVAYKPYADIISMLSALSVDRAVGEALQRLAKDANVPILAPLPATGHVTIKDLTFQKIETVIYAGLPPPVAGSTSIYVLDAKKFPPTGSIYLGRGTLNSEGPLQYISIISVSGGAYFKINLNPTTPTTKFHNINESVVLAQGGNRTIASNLVVQTLDESISYTTAADAIILDGETEVKNVPITATVPGLSGNVPRGAIQKVVGATFLASCFNENPLVNGRDADTDEDIRRRIKLFELTRSKGTRLAILAALQGLSDLQEKKTIVSASIVEDNDNNATVYIDDGSGYEPTFDGSGLETIVSSAAGGERYLQLNNFPIKQAFLEANFPGPYNLSELTQLTVLIDNVARTHIFKASDFLVPSAATAYEVAASINSNITINFAAHTSRGGSKVVIFPKDKNKNNIKVIESAKDANQILNFSKNQTAYTLRLYKNNKLLSQDGKLAFIETKPQSQWATSIVSGDTLIYSVDETPPIAVTFNLIDFQKIDPLATVGHTTSLDIWAKVFARKMSGVSASVENNVIKLYSNRGKSSEASLKILGGTLKNKIFHQSQTLESFGADYDYTLNLNTGQIELVENLNTNDVLSAGSAIAQAHLFTAPLPNGVNVFGSFWMVIDGDARVVPNELSSNNEIRFVRNSIANNSLVRNSNVVTVTTAVPHNLSVGAQIVIAGATPASFNGNQIVTSVPSPTSFEFENIGPDESATVSGTTEFGDVTLQARNILNPSVFEGFTQVSPGDWLLVIAETTDPVALQKNSGFWRVKTVNTGNVTFFNGSGSNTAWMSGLNTSNIIFVSTQEMLQRIDFSPSSLIVLADSISSQISGASVDTVESKIRIKTNSLSLSGQVFVAGANIGGKTLGFFSGQTANNTDSHFGFVATQKIPMSVPSFSLSSIKSVYSNDEISLVDNYLDVSGSEDDYIQFLKSYDLSSQSVLSVSNQNQFLWVQKYLPAIDRIKVKTPIFLSSNRSRINHGDRVFFQKPLSLTDNDSLLVVLDQDSTTKTLTLPVSRKIVVNNQIIPTLNSFSADDSQSDLPLNHPNSFFDFDFSDFKIWRRARGVLSDGVYNLLVQNYDFGPNGNTVRVGFVYPDDSSQTEVTHKIVNGECSTINIVIPVDTVRVATWDGTTAFTVFVTNVGAKQTITYTYRAGTQPDFLGGSNVQVGDIAIIKSSSSFLNNNKGFSAKITNVTPTTFTVQTFSKNATTDELTLLNIDNQNGIIQCVTNAPHNLSVSDRIGLYDTAELSPGVFPFNTAYYIQNVINPTTFTVLTPPGTPNGTISSATHTNNVITVNAANHGLQVGNIVKISGATIATYNGVFGVFEVPSAHQFKLSAPGSGPSIANDGRFDFQSFVPQPPSVSITNATRSLDTVTVDTATPHGLSVGNLVQITNLNIAGYSNTTTYNVGDVIEFAGNLYKSLINGNLGNQPDISPLAWAITTFDLQGIMVVNSTPSATQFTYKYRDVTGSTVATGGNATLLSPSGKLARCVGINADGLQFVKVNVTPQQIIDYSLNELNEKLLIQNNGGPLNTNIDVSTEDLGLTSNYISGNISNLKQFANSHAIEITVDVNVLPGGTITISGISPSYDASYIVLKSRPSGTNYILTLQSKKFSYFTANTATSATFMAKNDCVMLSDGENSVLVSNLNVNPNFMLKRPFDTPPQIGEELKLVASNFEHLHRFWQKLIVTGFSSLGELKELSTKNELQLNTKIFGRTGSIQILNSSANKIFSTISTSGLNIDNKVGVFTIPYSFRKHISVGSWLKLFQTVSQPKILGFNPNTQVKVLSDGLELINTTNGTFQTKRNITHDFSTKLLIERHGRFSAIIAIDGAMPNFDPWGVIEGDWVRLTNSVPQQFNPANSYFAGDKIVHNNIYYLTTVNISAPAPTPPAAPWIEYGPYNPNTLYSNSGIKYTLFDNRLWEAVSAVPFSGVTPGTDNTKWHPKEFHNDNLGIFRIVRVLGNNTLWVDAHLTEELVHIFTKNNFSVYSYDSVMPGDLLKISGPVLGANNIGSYVVLDDSNTSRFPTPTRIYTSPIPQPSGPSFLFLGDSVEEVAVLEKDPLVVYKKILALGPAQNDDQALVVVDTPNLVDRFNNWLGAGLNSIQKINLDETLNVGIDGYVFFKGLIKLANTVVYGDANNQLTYPGFRAAGTSVAIAAALIKRIKVTLSVRVHTNIPTSIVIENVKMAVAGYINQLKVGEPISLPKIIAAASQVNGVVSALLISPSLESGDIIFVGANQVAKIINPTEDIVVNLIGFS